MVQSRRDRLDRQRERQRAYRAKMKSRRRPSRDDIARALLHFMVTKALERGGEEDLFRLQDQMVELLAGQGFDRKASEAAFEDLVERYRSGWRFQRKVHLGPADGEGGD
jgi:hypothetical protein